MVNGVDIPLGNLHLAARGSQEASADMPAEGILVQISVHADKIRTGLPVIDDPASPQLFSHVFLITPGRDRDFAKVRQSAQTAVPDGVYRFAAPVGEEAEL